MFTITDEAAEKVKEVLEAEGKSDWGLRILIAGSSCCGPSYAMDLEKDSRDGDEIIEKNGLKVFADQDTYGKLKGMKMDFIDDGQSQGFVIKMEGPDAAPPSCGCSSGSCG